MTSGTLYIISSPSGGGKTSLVHGLLNAFSNLEVSISHTTRSKRPGEMEGDAYFFVEKAVFEELVKQNAFLEHADVFGNAYGTSRQWVEAKLAAGVDVILEIDWQGAAQIRKIMPTAVGIFILPPSCRVLQQRLEGRGQDNEAIIAKRMAAARNEMSHCLEYDYLVINDAFEQALVDLSAIIRARRLRCEVQKKAHKALLDDLLA